VNSSGLRRYRPWRWYLTRNRSRLTWKFRSIYRAFYLSLFQFWCSLGAILNGVESRDAAGASSGGWPRLSGTGQTESGREDEFVLPLILRKLVSVANNELSTIDDLVAHTFYRASTCWLAILIRETATKCYTVTKPGEGNFLQNPLRLRPKCNGFYRGPFAKFPPNFAKIRWVVLA